MNLKRWRKWTSALTLCAVTMTASAVPALAANDTAFVGNNASSDTAVVGSTTPNLQAAADAMAAAMNQLASGNQGGTSSGNNGSGQASGDTATVAVDYVSLNDPAVTIDGQTYLPLRATFGAMKDHALTVTWKAEGQQKIELSTAGGTSYEVYLTDASDGVQVQQGGTTYTVKNVSSVTYVPLSFFQAIIPNATISLSGDQILVLSSTNASDVWSGNFWGNMNAYQSPAPAPQPEPEPTPEPPQVSYPEVSVPSVPQEPVTPPSDNSGSTGGSGSGTVTNGSLLWPTTSHLINSYYGYRIDPVGGVSGDFHLGLDINGGTGDPVYAALGGTVIRASWFSTYGNCIDIQHPNGLVTRYAHLSAYHVSVGDTVTQGQLIADIGATGNVTGPHLHFETLVNGSTVDPLTYFE